ncbi:hypothetical protein F511_20534 [Dorcoceras hygrometricum]|uniref:Uncharacterized protein n=1 Tax=Dorcoceras hygrometricum TaxID=472368 RepID=A0A2Z7CSX1_9LAMI|nr:hypothetical protein F511_20534 [Dorcoceras hygrometricum]
MTAEMRNERNNDVSGSRTKIWEHCDVLSMQMDSDLVIYRTTLVRTFQVVTICRVDKFESTGCVLGKWVYLVTLAMPLFDLQYVCIVIGSLATLNLPMVVDLIGIYVWKGPYCTLTTTNWFLQALSVIPRESWDDVARRFTMIRWATPKQPPTSSPLGRTHAPLSATHAPPPIRRTCSGHRAEEIPSVVNLSDLLVQTDKGIVIPVVDLIRRSTAAYLLKCWFPCETGRSQAPRRQQDVCIAIGSLATLDLPMVVDLIGIYVLKGPYCTLTTTNWFLQALSVIPRGSWRDVARRFTMIRWIGRPPPRPAAHRARLGVHGVAHGQQPRALRCAGRAMVAHVARPMAAVVPLAGRPLPAYLAHWLRDVGAASALLCAMDGARIGATLGATCAALGAAERGLVPRAMWLRPSPCCRRPAMLRRCRDGWFVF